MKWKGDPRMTLQPGPHVGFLVGADDVEDDVQVVVRTDPLDPTEEVQEVSADSSRRSIEGATLPGVAGRSRSWPSTNSTSRFGGATKIAPSSSGADSSTTLIGRLARRRQAMGELCRSGSASGGWPPRLAAPNRSVAVYSHRRRVMDRAFRGRDRYGVIAPVATRFALVRCGRAEVAERQTQPT